MRNEVIRRTAKATGIGMTTVKSVKREFMTTGGFSSQVLRDMCCGMRKGGI